MANAAIPELILTRGDRGTSNWLHNCDYTSVLGPTTRASQTIVLSYKYSYVYSGPPSTRGFRSGSQAKKLSGAPSRLDGLLGLEGP